jgi:hypothetical protein
MHVDRMHSKVPLGAIRLSENKIVFVKNSVCSRRARPSQFSSKMRFSGRANAQIERIPGSRFWAHFGPGWTQESPSGSLGITRNPAKLGCGPRNLSFQRRPRFDVGSILKLPFDVLKFRANPQESPSGSLGITRNPAKLGVGPRNLSFQRRPRFDVGSILKLPFDVLKF